MGILTGSLLNFGSLTSLVSLLTLLGGCLGGGAP